MSATSREVALEVVRRVTDEAAFSNRVLPALLARSGLDVRDRAFATELALGTLRHLPWLDHAIASRANRPVARMSPGARHPLRLGAYQLLVAGTPAHAAVGESVALAGGRERGFVNAVLRRLAEDIPEPPAGDDDASLGLRSGLARWAVQELRTQLGDEAPAAAEALATRAPLSLRAADPPALLARLRAAGIEAEPGGVDASCILVARGDPSTLPGARDGAFAVQDQASVFVVRALDPTPGDLVADVCAAPGGKARFVADLVGREGRVVAGDLHPRRAALIRAGARPGEAAPWTIVHDARRPPLVDAAFDRVLVDAPCSGIGSARRRPELLWRGSKEAVAGLALRQLEIVRAAAGLLRPGGRLVYAVCTFPRAETDAVVDELIARTPDLRPVPTAGPDGPAERHRLWPHRHGSDGMFVAAFERAA